MTQWIVEGTRIESFRLAQSLAQQHADRSQALIPLVKDCGLSGLVVVKMICPCRMMSRSMAGPAFPDGTSHPIRFAPGAAAPAWDQPVPNRLN